MIPRRFAPILLLCVSLVASAQAQEAETDAAAGKQPIEITAEGGIEWDRNAQTYTARGAAQARRGALSVSAASGWGCSRVAEAPDFSSASGPGAGLVPYLVRWACVSSW